MPVGTGGITPSYCKRENQRDQVHNVFYHSLHTLVDSIDHWDTLDNQGTAGFVRWWVLHVDILADEDMRN